MLKRRTRLKYTKKMLIRDLFSILDDFKANGKESQYSSKDFMQAIEMLARYSKDEWKELNTDFETVFYDFILDEQGNKSGGYIEVDGVKFQLKKL